MKRQKISSLNLLVVAMWIGSPIFVLGQKIQEVPEYSFLMPAILWDPRNPLFHCPNRGVNRINVRLNDYLIFGCPAEGKNLEWFDSASTLHTEMYENGFLTENRALMDQCNATTIPTKFMNCNNPKSPVYRTIRVAEMVASDSEPIFTSNKSYYFFGTGTGRSVNMDQKVGGRCVGEDHTSFKIHKLKLEIRVCANGEAGTASCPICLTAACYNNGCGMYSAWNTTQKFIAQNNSCFEVYRRSCDNVGGSCDGPFEKLVPVDMSSCIVAERKFVQRNDTCYAVFSSVCDEHKAYIVSRNETKCNATGTWVKVGKHLCKEYTRKNPEAKQQKGEETGVVSVAITIFALCLLLPLITGIVLGLCLGYVFAKKSLQRTTFGETNQLTYSRKELCM